MCTAEALPRMVRPAAMRADCPTAPNGKKGSHWQSILSGAAIALLNNRDPNLRGQDVRRRLPRAWRCFAAGKHGHAVHPRACRGHHAERHTGPGRGELCCASRFKDTHTYVE
jgi:hypothetical protein